MRNSVFLLLFFCVISCSREPASFCILETSDLHGELGAYGSSSFEYIRQARETYGDRLILLYGGDLLQGAPETYYASYVDTASISIYAKLFNAQSYDVLTPGNHDMEAGREVCDKIFNQMDAQLVCANILERRTKKPFFSPYAVLKRGDYKIVVLGLISTESVKWLPNSTLETVEFQPMLETAQKWVKKIYQREHPDLVIGLFHTGSASTDKDSAYEIARNVPGIHLMCCGHTHQDNVLQTISPNNDAVSLMNPSSNGHSIARADVVLTPLKRGKVKVEIRPQIISMDNQPTSVVFDSITSPFLARANAYYNIPISSIEKTIFSNDAYKGPCPWTDMLHRSYRKMTEEMGFVRERAVTVTVVSPSFPNVVLHEGALTLKDFIAVYPYENTLSVVEMLGSELKDYMEYSYHLALDFPDNPIYVFDTFSGFRYTVNLNKPYGERVTILGEKNGNQFYSAMVYRVAMNSFRAGGGNGHLSEGLGWSQEKIKARTLTVSQTSIRDMMVSLYATQPVDIEPLNEWSYL